MLGIDIGDHSVKAAVVVNKGRKFSVSQFFYETLPISAQDGNVNDELRDIVKGIIKKSKQSDVVFSIPSSNAIMKTIPMNSGMSDDELEGELQLELMNFVPFPIEQVYMDFTVLGASEEEGKDDVFVVAAKIDDVEKIADLAVIKKVKLKRKIVDLDVFAYGQLIEAMKGRDYSESFGIIDIGKKSTKIFVFRQGELVYTRVQQIGGQQFTDIVAEMYEIDPDEAERKKLTPEKSEEFQQNVTLPYLDSLSEQIGLALELYASSDSNDVDVFYLCGAGALVDVLLETVSENIPNQKFEYLPLEQAADINKVSRKGLDEKTMSLVGSMVTGLAMAR